ncbi:MAG: ATP-binding protein [Bradymonadaceae bacterium]
MSRRPDQLGILDNLVTQFSSALDCFRELVQNSIDAGSHVVEVWTEFVPDRDAGGIIIHVDDFGEGMGKEIIDTELTRLFASGKRRDLTKIGKFGIGFISVFALNPRAVLVRTGRSGEHWEVFFDADRSFQVSPLTEPVEGTQVSIILEGDAVAYQEFVGKIHETLLHWCCHAEAEVTFENRTPLDGSPPTRETINQPFEVDGLFAGVVDDRGTHVAMAYTKEPEHSFFNRGLTLARGARGTAALEPEYKPRFERIAFKVSSAQLEHTLTRETVIRDTSFHRTIERLEGAARTILFDPLVDRIEALVLEEHWGIQEVMEYLRLADYLSREPVQYLRTASRRALLRRLDGRPATLREAYTFWKRDGHLLLALSPSTLTDKLAAEHIPVFVGEAGVDGPEGEPGALNRLLRRYLDFRTSRTPAGIIARWLDGVDLSDRDKPITHADRLYAFAEPSPGLDGALQDLVSRSENLLKSLGLDFNTVTTGELWGLEDRNASFFVISRLGGPLLRLVDVEFASRWALRRYHLIIDVSHPHLQLLLKVSQRAPALAAYCLASSIAEGPLIFRGRDQELFARAFTNKDTIDIDPNLDHVLDVDDEREPAIATADHHE